jgi:hypothetical protein
MACANVDWTFKAFQYLCFVALEHFSCKGTFFSSQVIINILSTFFSKSLFVS